MVNRENMNAVRIWSLSISQVKHSTSKPPCAPFSLITIFSIYKTIMHAVIDIFMDETQFYLVNENTMYYSVLYTRDVFYVRREVD